MPSSLEQSSMHRGERFQIPPPRGGVISPIKHVCLFSPFLPGSLAGLLPVLSCSKYPVSYFTSSGKDPTAKVPFQLSFPIGCSLTDKLLRRGKREGAEVGKTGAHPFVVLQPPVLCVMGWRPAAWPQALIGSWDLIWPRHKGTYAWALP